MTFKKLLVLNNWQFIITVVFCVVLFFFEGRLSIRLDQLELTMWGESQAPAVIDPTVEITGYDYDNIEVRLSLEPTLAPLITLVFSDEVINCAEYEEVDVAFRAIGDKERTERSIDDAKADLRKALKQ